MTLVRALIKEINAFMKRHFMSPTSFGLKAAKDPHFVFELKAGTRRPRPLKVHQVRQFMRDYKPKGQ